MFGVSSRGMFQSGFYNLRTKGGGREYKLFLEGAHLSDAARPPSLAAGLHSCSAEDSVASSPISGVQRAKAMINVL